MYKPAHLTRERLSPDPLPRKGSGLYWRAYALLVQVLLVQALLVQALPA